MAPPRKLSKATCRKGEMVVTGQTITGGTAQTNQTTTAPGFGGAQRGGGGRRN